MTHEFETLAQVEQFAAERGIVLTPADRAKIAAIQRSEMERLDAITPSDRPTTFADRWNTFFPRLLAAIVGVGAAIITVAQTVIVSLGAPVILVLLLFVEKTRVQHGIELFEATPALAAVFAWALVLLNLVLEFTVHHIEHTAKYVAARDRRWSLRIWSQNMAYRLGLGESWSAVELSPAQRYKRLAGLVTFTILALALAGSMRNVIDQQEGAWYMALVSIVTESTLLEIITWAGGLLAAAAAVLSAQGISRYLAIRVVEILNDLHEQPVTADDARATIERAGAVAAYAVVQSALDKRSAKQKPVNGHHQEDFQSAPALYTSN